ncbi:hypothetical protein [Sphingosinicella terrae]|jgi:hypothetical protein|uniref:hypothetical protein n=1 Tax=Sphingosinicella terrae TaxID=2172047 RepID=UPI000E0CCB46|nr:hypothetical protein [Sphingosinicella terrae]
MRSLVRSCLIAALAASAPAHAQSPAPAPEPSQPNFRSLWTGWATANDQAMRREAEAQRRVEQDLATADADRRHRLANQGRALGELVGETVRLGDCEEGERMAREAGDFALVEAVRHHCRGRAIPVQSRR